MDKKLIESASKSNGIIRTLVTDLSGGLREIIFPAHTINDIIESGIAYDGSSFEGVNEINASDSIIKGDPQTLVKIPQSIADTEQQEYWIICDILDTNGNTHPNCVRSALRTQQQKLKKIWNNGELMVGAEPEAFFVEDRNKIGEIMGENSNYFNPRDPKIFIMIEICQVLSEMGFKIERSHPEVGNEQFEINWEFDTAERTADRIQIYKLVAHKVAQKHGIDVTFLPKPYPNQNGSGMHCHLSVQGNGKNLFFDKNNQEQHYFSDTALKFLAGILKYSPNIAAVSNPAEASYARLVPGYEAPCIIAIGSYNRSAAARIPAISDLNTLSKAIRAEFRYPDPLANSYLLMHAFITAGIIGIEKDTTFKGFTEENLFALSMAQIKKKRLKLLPRNLWEAYSYFVMNPEFTEKFGSHLHKSYANLILKEIDECQPFANKESMRRHFHS
ncbi:hypothetical protein CSB37_04260 [bacterium DOLZORAL124_38_8]|nr:MAG: hypothetical protein CSB37_04260 [bacterium DOLZORAL124_38_8]